MEALVEQCLKLPELDMSSVSWTYIHIFISWSLDYHCWDLRHGWIIRCFESCATYLAEKQQSHITYLSPGSRRGTWPLGLVTSQRWTFYSASQIAFSLASRVLRVNPKLSWPFGVATGASLNTSTSLLRSDKSNSVLWCQQCHILTYGCCL